MVSEAAIEAYCLTGDFEQLLRRLVRWQLRGKYGRLWLTKLNGLDLTIEENRRREVSRGLYDRVSSELSYLGLPDLFAILAMPEFAFNSLLGTRVPRSDVVRVTSLRNRVAHFRGVGASDLQAISKCSWIAEALHSFFSSKVETMMLADPSEPGAEELVKRLGLRLSELCHPALLASYSQYEQTGRKGFVTRLGIFHHHLCLEGYCERGYFDARAFVNWFASVGDRVTLIRVGALFQYVRIFVPVLIPTKEASKCFRAAVSLMEQCVRPDMAAEFNPGGNGGDLDPDFLLVESPATSVGYAL